MFKFLLYPISSIYGLIISIRNFLYDYKVFKSTEFEIPVISIGNITVGGTGKTPHTEYMVELLRKQFIVTTISRGYKRKTKGYLEVKAESLATAVGDEPLQIKNKFRDVQVVVDEKRVHAIKKIQQQQPADLPDVILLDDAFQHRSVNPGINILLIDFNRPIDKDRLMPVGRLREAKMADAPCQCDYLYQMSAGNIANYPAHYHERCLLASLPNLVFYHNGLSATRSCFFLMRLSERLNWHPIKLAFCWLPELLIQSICASTSVLLLKTLLT